MKTSKKINLPVVGTDLAYLCGVLAGDGYIGIREHKHEYVVHCAGNPHDEREFYNNIITKLFDTLFHIRVHPRLLSKGEIYGVVIYSKKLVEFLINDIGMGLSPKNNIGMPLLFKKDLNLALSFISGVADTDFCIKLKRGKYPIVAGAAKSKQFIVDISDVLEAAGFKLVKMFDYTVRDARLVSGHSTINRIEINGHCQFSQWVRLVGTRHPKHIKKISLWAAKNVL